MNKETIVIVEDDEDDRILLETYLKKVLNDFEYIFIKDGYEAIQYFISIEGNEDKMPNIVILDLNLPKFNGKELLHKLQDKPFFTDMCIVVYSTSNSEEEIEDCKRLGVRNFFTKATTLEQLKVTVRKIADLTQKNA